MTNFSNQYYLSARRPELSILVHEMWKIDKYRWETCIATANFYSLREDRATAIEYFQRLLFKLMYRSVF
jgi:anaphase-promoting complex subunit 8